MLPRGLRVIELSAPGLLVVVGSRSFSDPPTDVLWSREWAKAEVWRWMKCRCRVGFAFLSGGAAGPDSWGAAGARHLGADAVEYLLDGLCWVNGSPRSGGGARWTDESPPARGDGPDAWRRWCLKRDDAVAAAAARARDRAEALAVVAPWSRTQGAAYTARRLSGAGVPTSVSVAPRMPPMPPRPRGSGACYQQGGA